MSDVTVRQAVCADLDAIADLFDQYRQFQGRPADRAAARAFLQARFDHGESVVFLAELGARAAGFAQLYPSFSSVALQRVFILNDLFVAAPGRRRGVGRALLAAVAVYAGALGAERVSLNVARTNVEGQALYEAEGWQKDEMFFMYHHHPQH